MKQSFEVKMMAVALLMFMFTSTGCESIALLPRPAIDDLLNVSRRDLDRREGPSADPRAVRNCPGRPQRMKSPALCKRSIKIGKKSSFGRPRAE